ncbi:MAG: hypothetical protein CVU17_03505 [Betaproteobacteria bacterium HGW-Betaproteobacteria-11]|nr:MAG: hypothetical protein CVU17_03505 [Betaproteobacteria bacterium HGW-Betaproteobacteria-11]
MPDDNTLEILNQADALIGRRRVFVATPPEEESAGADRKETEPRPDTSNDIRSELPLLTEIVTPDEVASPLSEERQRNDAIQKELARWLDEDLPVVILKVTDGLADQLVQRITDQAASKLVPRLRACIEDPLASIPPDDPA